MHVLTEMTRVNGYWGYKQHHNRDRYMYTWTCVHAAFSKCVQGTIASTVDIEWLYIIATTYAATAA